VHLLGDYTDTINKRIIKLIDASKEVGLGEKCMVLSHHQNAGHSQDIKIANRSFENVSTVHIFGNDSKKSESDSGGNKVETEFYKDLLPFTLEPYVFLLLSKNLNIKI
jgi:hypothetical protein